MGFSLFSDESDILHVGDYHVKDGDKKRYQDCREQQSVGYGGGDRHYQVGNAAESVDGRQQASNGGQRRQNNCFDAVFGAFYDLGYDVAFVVALVYDSVDEVYHDNGVVDHDTAETYDAYKRHEAEDLVVEVERPDSSYHAERYRDKHNQGL